MENAMQEYPKALYRAGELVTVAGYDQEEAARADGFQDWSADHEAQEADKQDNEEDAHEDTTGVELADLPQRIPGKPSPKPKVK